MKNAEYHANSTYGGTVYVQKYTMPNLLSDWEALKNFDYPTNPYVILL